MPDVDEPALPCPGPRPDGGGGLGRATHTDPQPGKQPDPQSDRQADQQPGRQPIRLRLTLGYDGGGFSGWAAQPGLRTVEAVLGEALCRVLRTPADLRLVVAGRTDAGVHARGQVCHVDVTEAVYAALAGPAAPDPAQALLRRLRGVLPGDLRVHEAAPAAPGFDARFSALSRRYSYLVCDDPAGVPPLRRHDVLAHRHRLDLGAMNAAASGLVGMHDFAAFCRRREGATTVRTLLECSWSRDADGFALARVVADAFCHSMVRSLVGAVLPVGDGRRDIGWPAQLLRGGARDSRAVVVAAHGLVLEEVCYPDDGLLAERAAVARSVRALP